jgi:hypothetical protein
MGLCGRLDKLWSGQRLDTPSDPTAPTFTIDIVIGIVVGVVGAVGDQGKPYRLVQARPAGFCCGCGKVRTTSHLLVSNWAELYHSARRPSKRISKHGAFGLSFYLINHLRGIILPGDWRLLLCGRPLVLPDAGVVDRAYRSCPFRPGSGQPEQPAIAERDHVLCTPARSQ